MRFKVGDKAVYPSHGVAIIEGIEAREVGGSSIEFYLLQIVSSGAKLMVPVASSDRVGMRSLISAKEIERVYSILRQSSVSSPQRTWNRRFREFNDKLRSGAITDIAEVLRDLWALQATKELSYGEKKMLERTRFLLVSEISAAENKTSEDVEALIDQSLMIN